MVFEGSKTEHIFSVRADDTCDELNIRMFPIIRSHLKRERTNISRVASEKDPRTGEKRYAAIGTQLSLQTEVNYKSERTMHKSEELKMPLLRHQESRL